LLSYKQTIYWQRKTCIVTQKEVKMILVVGSTGMVGGEVCRLLTAKGKKVRSLVRATSDEGKVEALRNMGVETAIGDVRDRSSLDSACQRVTSVIATTSSMPFSYIPGQNDIQTVDTDGMISLIASAKVAGVKHFIYISFTAELDFPLRNAKRKVEAYLKESGLTYTILRPSYFSEVWLNPAVGFDPANAKAQIYGSGNQKISWISYQDVAQFAVASLDNPVARNSQLDLGGPEALSPLEVVRIYENLGGKQFEVQFVPEAALEEQQNSATDPMQQSFVGLMRCYAKGDPVSMEETLKAFPVKLTSVREHAQRTLVTN
jgi:uncharacterized protein YbjT (DUF2867 family)